jgi:hypothetical protein
MATFRGSGSVANGAAFPTEAELQTAIDEAEAAALAAANSQAAAEVNVTETETAQAAAETAQGLTEAQVALAEQAVVDAQSEVVLAQQAVTDAEAEVVLCEDQVTLAEAQVALATTERLGAKAAKDSAVIAQTGAETAETGALAAQVAAELAYDNFDDRYLGQKASDPTLDNDGNALLTGALYWNTTSDELKVYSGSAWGGVLLEVTADTLYQPLDDELSDIAALATTKGRMLVANGSAWVDLGVGTNDQVITADSAEAKGVKWGTPYAGPDVFHAAGQTNWTNGTNYSYAHGLGSHPDVVHGYYECVTTDGVYEPGDKVPFTYGYTYTVGQTGGLAWADETHVGVMNDGNPYIPAKSGTGDFTEDKTKWKITATAIKF